MNIFDEVKIFKPQQSEIKDLDNFVMVENDKYKVKNPITVIRNIMNQEDGEIYQLLEKRYMYLLEKVSTMSGIAGNQELLKYQKERRKELQALLQSDSLKAQYRRKEWFQLQLAAKSPGMYHIIHEIYSRITGSKDRYKV